MKAIEVSVDFGGRKLTLETGRLAKQADASVLATYGETMVLVAVVSAKEMKPNQDFFPLTVDFQEKYYSAGKIPGGFFKREAKPSDHATLSARLIDRPIRPLFPEDYLCETNIVATVLSTDGENDPDIVASIAASAALHLSDIPFNGPVGTCRVGQVNGEFVCNISRSQLPESTCELLVSGVRSGVVMVEGAAKEISEVQMMDAIDFAHRMMQPIFDMQDELKERVGKAKREYPKAPRDESLKKTIREAAWPGLKKAFAIGEKLSRYTALSEVKKAIKTKFIVEEPETPEQETKNGLVGHYFEETKSEFARELTLNSKHRIDGRAYDQIRPISCETGILPRVHGSALFTRGETQVLGAVTLGTSDDEQKIDALAGAYQKTFLLHYNFPPFSVGEARPLRGPGRREIGHGFLAERALSYIIPPKEVFPYTIRLVSEVLESNGSSSMATVCSGSMALMQAGVPIPKAVAGVAMGLIKEGEKFAVLSDILGDEDHLGDMDFKVCGTADGITAFQMDLKIGGVSRDIMEQALEQARAGRLHVLEKMNEAISKPAETVSRYAPRIFVMKVKPDKVREVIGSGGKVIRSIIERTGVKINIEDDGKINIASADEASANKAIEIITQIVEEPEIGRIYEGKVTRIADFGAFVEIIPGTEGLCHISELEHMRVRRVEDVVKEGEMIQVKCLDVDAQGKIRLSRKALLPKPSGPSRSDSGPSRPERAERSESRGQSDAPAESSDESGEMREEAEGLSAEQEAPSRPGFGGRNFSEEESESSDDNVGNRIDSAGRGIERSERGGGGGREPRSRFERPHRSDRSDRGGMRSDRGQGYDRGPERSSSDRGGYSDRSERGGDRRPDSRGGGRRPSGGGGGGGGGGNNRRYGQSHGDSRGPARGNRGGGGGGGGYGSNRGGGRPEGERGFRDQNAPQDRGGYGRGAGMRQERQQPMDRPPERPVRERENSLREVHESREEARLEPWEERPYLYDDED